MAIRARGLRRSYGDHVVLDGVDLDVEDGTIYALLSPHGAGKLAGSLWARRAFDRESPPGVRG